MAYQNDNERRQYFEDRNIADDRQEEQVLKGIQPKNQFAFRVFKFFRILGILFVFLALAAFGLTFVSVVDTITGSPLYYTAMLGLGAIGLGMFILMFLVKLLFLRKAPFDDWVFEVAQRDLGIDVIFYTSKCLYIKYDIASAKEVDKRDFVTPMR